MQLPFKSNADCWEYCNRWFSAAPKKGEARPAIVPTRGFMNIENHVSRLDDGRYRVSLLVCGSPSGFFLIAETPKATVGQIEHGDLLLWQAFKSPPFFGKGRLGRATGDKRSDWVGFIVAKIAPEIAADGKYTAIEYYN